MLLSVLQCTGQPPPHRITQCRDITVRPRLRNFDLGMSWNIQATGLGLNPHLPGLIVHSSQWRTDGYETCKVDRALLQQLPVVAYYLLTPGATLTMPLTVSADLFSDSMGLSPCILGTSTL